MRWIWLVVLLAGCDTAYLQQMDSKTARMSELRTREGVCVEAHAVSARSFEGLQGYIQTCARRGSAQTLHDNPSDNVAIVDVQMHTIGAATPDRWQLTILHNGVRVYQGMLPHSIPALPGTPGGYWHGIAVVPMPEPWGPGRWDFQYVAEFDTEIRAATWITFGGAVTAAPGAAAVAAEDPCKALPDCTRSGLCTGQGEKCIAGKDADCKASGGCRMAGLCHADAGKCVK